MNEMLHLIAKKVLPVKFRRILINVLNFFIVKLIFLSHRAGLVSPISWLWQKSLKTLDVSSKNPEGTILVFNSPGGLADLESAYRDKKATYHIKYIDGELIKTSCRYYLGDGITEYNGTLDKVGQEARNKYRTFIRTLLCRLENDIKLIGIINFNHIYHAQRDVATVAADINLPFITLLKECLRTPRYSLETEYVYKNIIKNYEGRKIAVHNEMTKGIILNSGIVDESQVEVVGQGRSDELFSMRASKSEITNKDKECKKILYFAISDTAGLPYFGGVVNPSTNGEIPLLNWARLARDVGNLMVEYVNSRDDVELIIKGKPSGVYSDELSSKNKNIINIHGNPDMRLYAKADIVVGFNTTGLVEAVAAGIPTLTTYFEIDEQNMKPYLFDWFDCVDILRKKEELFDKLDHYLFDGGQVTASEQNVTKLLSHYLGNSDGKAGRRIRKFIDENINLDKVGNKRIEAS